MHLIDQMQFEPAVTPALDLISHLIYARFEPALHLLCTCVTPALHLLYTCFTPALHLLYTEHTAVSSLQLGVTGPSGPFSRTPELVFAKNSLLRGTRFCEELALVKNSFL